MCILLTPVLYFITTVMIEVYLQCFTESVSLRDIGNPTSRPEISSPSSLYLKAVKAAHIGSAFSTDCNVRIQARASRQQERQQSFIYFYNLLKEIFISIIFT